ncbi:MAG TPA: hypothetical protein VF629_21725 [Hymenobacter sp.]|jgi:hypothetical protein|uniref:hypothetical protein n=1 Tax=Hymenobacter sp. TaxID=1898978 RepID=UPI002EDB6A6E
MKNYFIKTCALVLLSVGIFSCEKDYGPGLGPLEDSVAEIPVTVTNATTIERFPVVTTSVGGGGNITIELAIPADKGTIKQITKVATSSSVVALNLANINSTVPVSSLNSAPINGNGTNAITFKTTLADYLRYRNSQPATASLTAAQVRDTFGPVGPNAGTPPVPTIPVPSTNSTPTDIAFYFLIELEGGTTIIPRPVRVRVLP